MEPGKVVKKRYWFCIDHLDGSMWVYCIDGSQWLVGIEEGHIAWPVN